MNVSMDEQNHVSFSVHNYTVSLGISKLFYIPFQLVIKQNKTIQNWYHSELFGHQAAHVYTGEPPESDRHTRNQE